jgi:hypothetical protein
MANEVVENLSLSFQFLEEIASSSFKERRIALAIKKIRKLVQKTVDFSPKPSIVRIVTSVKVLGICMIGTMIVPGDELATLASAKSEHKAATAEGLGKSNGKLHLNMNKKIICFALGLVLITGCTTVSVYQDPISKNQIAVNTANDVVRPYLVGVNDLNVRANLYDKLALGKPWGSEDLANAIPFKEIQVRLQAMKLLSAYANALAAVAGSKNVVDLQTAAKNMGEDVNGLKTTVVDLASVRRANGTANAAATQAAKLDLSQPISALTALVGTMVIEHQQREAVETAILDGNKPINDLIDLLKGDLKSLSVVDNVAYAAIQSDTVFIYNEVRQKTDAKGSLDLMNQLIQENGRLQTLRALQIDSLLSDMEDSHNALVTFCKSSKTPKDLASLSSQIDVFTAHVKLFDDAIISIDNTVKAAK